MNLRTSRPIQVALFLVAIAQPSRANADCHSYTNMFDTTEIRCDDGTTGTLHTNKNGTTVGHIGNREFTSYKNEFGTTNGRIGNLDFNSHTNVLGTTYGRVGSVDFNSYTNEFGTTIGRFGNTDFTAYTNGMGTTTQGPNTPARSLDGPAAMSSVTGPAYLQSLWARPTLPTPTPSPSPSAIVARNPFVQSATTTPVVSQSRHAFAPPAPVHRVAQKPWTGMVTNVTAGVNARLKVALREVGGVLAGDVTIEEPLSGSGSVTGLVLGKGVRFTTYGEGWVIEWEGEISPDAMVGTYRVVGTDEWGRWWVSR